MKKLWTWFILITGVSFAVLGLIGRDIYRNAPPIPDRVVSSDGAVVIGDGDIERGQAVWQSMGGMELGSVWGHGSYVAPDWTADWLHREVVFVLDGLAKKEYRSAYTALSPEKQAALREEARLMFRANGYDSASGTLTIPPLRAQAFGSNLDYYSSLFVKGSSPFAIPAGALKDPAELRQLCAFFFWTSWTAAAVRPGSSSSYTNNWPHEPLIGNNPTGQAIVWTGLSVILLLAGIAGMVTFYARKAYAHAPAAPPSAQDPFLTLKRTPSQRAAAYYFAAVVLLLLAQIGFGAITAHYGVEGNGFYGIPLDRWLPYAVTRTWHIQLGLFWIATAWLAAGLFIGPVISGYEPEGQAVGVYALLAALVVIVAGSMAGEWASVFRKFTGDEWFYWGHQGYEYLDLGRVWQAGLFSGLLIWLGLIARCVLPALKKGGEDRHLLAVFLMSTFAIALLYGAGLMWGAHTNLTLAEYWRWWVVHLWVEGFFEVFATVVIAFLFYKMGLVEPGSAARASLLSATVYLSGGIIGTLHHLYFAGTPAVAMAFGSVFSALEVVPLVLMGYEAWEHVRVAGMAPWVRNYKWPIRFFIAVAFWNMVGAGLFGFMINPPIALYYMQGLNTTPVHGHGALFGVYGMLGIGLMLFCLRVLKPEGKWRDGALATAFWGMNVGLLMMIVLSLLPLGLLQTLASVNTGYWYARSAQFMQEPLMNVIRWMRVPGDTVFAAGALALALFLGGLVTGHSYASED